MVACEQKIVNGKLDMADSIEKSLQNIQIQQCFYSNQQKVEGAREREKKKVK